MLILELNIIGNMLPFAATTGAEMTAKRLNPILGIRMELNRGSLHKAGLLSGNPNIYYISWGYFFNKNDLLIYPCNALALSRNAFD